MKKEHGQRMIKSSNYQQLGNIASIRSGYTFRERVEEVADGNAGVLQIKDLRRQHESRKTSVIFSEELPTIRWDGGDKTYLRPGSVVLPARGEYYRASYLDAEQHPLPIIASSQFLIITPRKREAIPSFICWSLNQPAAQFYLAQESRGTNMPMINTKSVSQLKIPLPSLSVQKRIVELQQLWEQEQQLTQQLLNNREVMLKGMFQKLLKEEQ